MNLASLPGIQFCETDTAAVEAALMADFERITGRTLYPGNPERLFLEAVAYLIAQQRYLIDFAGKMNLVSLSAGGYLDHLGALLNTTRLGDTAARTSLEFSLATPLAWDLVIPAGTRATAGAGELIWATTAEAQIPAGQTRVTVEAVCQQSGAVGNGLLPGQINRLVDRIGYLSGVANTSLSLGGANTEGDERFRDRVQLAPERLGVCGPREAYRWWAMSVSQEIGDVAVWSPEPGQVSVAPLMTDGQLPPAAIIAAVNAAVNDKRVRPLTDVVRVVSPEPVEFDLVLTWFVLNSYAHLAGSIAQRVESEAKAYASWQRARLGRSLRPSELVARIQAIDGVQRVEVAQPAYQAVQPWQVATARQISLTYGGLSDE